MELDEEELNDIYQQSYSLNDFINNYGRKHAISPLIMGPLSMLSDQDIIDLVDWWRRKRANQKYTVRLLPGDAGFLNYSKSSHCFFINDASKTSGIQTGFTKDEISKFKRSGFAIDWDKADIEPVEDDN